MYSKSAELRMLFTDTLNKVSQMAHNMGRSSHQPVKQQFAGEMVPIPTAKIWVSVIEIGGTGLEIYAGNLILANATEILTFATNKIHRN
jgi:hypothetical protein